MSNQNEIQDDKFNFNQYRDDMLAFISSENKAEKETIASKLICLKDNLIKSKIPENIVKGAIISYILTDNNKRAAFKVKKEKALAKNLIKNFFSNNITKESLNNLNEKFKEYSPFRTMISFRNEISEEKKYLEFYFKIMMINQNISDILEGIRNILSVKNENLENFLKKLNFKNPYATMVIRDLLNELIIADILLDNNIILESVIKKLKNYYYLFHCPNCMGILYINISEYIYIKCVKCNNLIIIKDINQLKKHLNYNLKCANCQNEIEIYGNNYKCLGCNKFYCQNCFNDHEKDKLNHILINIYEVSFICEKHYELYSTFCALCKMNLCNLCKEKHIHRIDKIKYKLNDKLIEDNKKKKFDELIKVNDFVLAKLSYLHEFMKDFSYKNDFIRLSIWFMEIKKRKDNVKNTDFYFDTFFNEEFKNYYSSLILNASKGKSGDYKLLLEIKKNYELIEKEVDESFLNFKEKCQEKKFDRYISLNNWVSEGKEIFNRFEFNNNIIGLNSDIIDLKNKSIELENDIELLKIKILSLLKSNDLYASFLMKLINRYLSDFLIRKLIEKYPSDFETIEINPKNFFEIAVNYNDILLKNGYLKELSQKFNLEKLIQDLNNETEEKEKIKILKSFIENPEDNNDIRFKNNKIIGNKNYTANELNFVLDSFFYFKFQGNTIAHINITPDDSIKLKRIDINVQDINYFLNIINNINKNNKIYISNKTMSQKNINKDESQICNFENKDAINDTSNNLNKIYERIVNNINCKKKDWLEVEKDIEKGVNKLIDSINGKIVSDFYDSSITNKLTIKDIINAIFKNDFNKIFNSDSAFTRALSQSINDLIKNKKLDLDFSKLNRIKNIIFQVSEECDSIDDLIDTFKDFKLSTKDIIYRHIKTYINHNINDAVSNDSGELNISYTQSFKSLIKKITIIYDMDEIEKKALIMSLILPEIKSIELKYLNNFIIGLQQSIKNYYILENTKNLLKDLHKTIEDYMKQNTNNNQDLLSEIKNFIKKKKSSSMNVEMTYEKLIEIISKLFGKEAMEWTKLPDSDISLESLLFYYQNN